MNDKTQRVEAINARLEHLREHLAALVSYGNGEGTRAETARGEIGDLEVELHDLTARRPRKEA